MEKETYKIAYKCRNCGRKGTKNIEKGTPRPDYTECPNCKNMTETETHKPDFVWYE